MSALLNIREQVQRFYSRFSLQLTIVLRFILGLIVYHVINANLGYLEVLSSGFVTFGLALITAFFPLMMMVVAATLLILAHLYALSMPVMAVTAAVFLVLYCFYFRFTPNKSWLLLIVPLAFHFNVPLIIPVIFGLLGSPIMIVPAASGALVFHMLNYLRTTEATYEATDISGMLDVVVDYSISIFDNPFTWVMAAALGVGILVTYGFRTRSFQHSWKVAYVVGSIFAFIAILVGSSALELEISVASAVFDVFVAIIVGIILEFLFFKVDYSKTEYLQFSDNDYYYYVKAVPIHLINEAEEELKSSKSRSSLRGAAVPVGNRKNERPAKQTSLDGTDELLTQDTGDIYPLKQGSASGMTDADLDKLGQTMVIDAEQTNKIALATANQADPVLPNRSMKEDINVEQRSRQKKSPNKKPVRSNDRKRRRK